MCSLHPSTCQILTGKVPLGHIPYVDFIELVVKLKVRPNRPADDRSRFLDDLWPLAEACWSEDPSRRPSAGQVCDAMKLVLEHSVKKVTPATPRKPSIGRPSLPLSPQSARDTSTGGRSDASSSISGRRVQATSPSSAGRGPSLITTPPKPYSHRRDSPPPVHLPPLRLPTHVRIPSSQPSANDSLWSPQSLGTPAAERTSSPEGLSPTAPTLASEGSYPHHSSTLSTAGTQWSDLFYTPPLELDLGLSSTQIGGNSPDNDTDDIRSPGTSTRRPSFVKRLFGGRTTNKGPDFRIDDRYHPIPKCRNTSVEKWTLDDMLDRYIRSSGQFVFTLCLHDLAYVSRAQTQTRINISDSCSSPPIQYSQTTCVCIKAFINASTFRNAILDTHSFG